MDIRIPPTVDLKQFEAELASWCADADVSYSFTIHTPENKVTGITDDSVWWQAFQASCSKMGITLQPEIFPAATDSYGACSDCYVARCSSVHRCERLY
jgi:aminoacylase